MIIWIFLYCAPASHIFTVFSHDSSWNMERLFCLFTCWPVSRASCCLQAVGGYSEGQGETLAVGCVCVCVCVFVCACAQAHLRVCKQWIEFNFYIHQIKCVCVCVCVCLCVHRCVQDFVCTFRELKQHNFVCVCVAGFLCVFLGAWMYECVFGHLCLRMCACACSYWCLCMPAQLFVCLARQLWIICVALGICELVWLRVRVRAPVCGCVCCALLLPEYHARYETLTSKGENVG